VRTTATYTLTSADSGSTVATNAALTGLRYLTPPAVRGPAVFELTDSGDPYMGSRTLYRVDLNAAPWAYPQNNSGSIWQALIADANIGFNALTVRVPGGAVLEVDCS
jgi:hypothetical protein